VAAVTNYVTEEEVKAALTLSGTAFADQDIPRAIAAASRAVDGYCNRRFYLDTSDVARTYRQAASIIAIDDLAPTPVPVVKTAATPGQFTTTWTAGQDYDLQPLNAAADSRPYTILRTYSWAATGRVPYANIQITGRWGWTTIPAQVPQATVILASKLLVRTRQAPFGIVTAGGDVGVAMRIASTDPDVRALLEDLGRTQLAV